jgi:DNA-binding CsgD family transcriptional regulator
MTTMIDDPYPRTHGKSERSVTAALTPLLDGPAAHRVWVMAAFLLGALTREAPGDLDTAAPTVAPDIALTQCETRVLHYLPTNLSAREIAGELYLSVNTVKTHQRHLYQKLGARSRSQAVERARAFGLLALPARRHLRPARRFTRT